MSSSHCGSTLVQSASSMRQSASSFIHCNLSSPHCGYTLVQSASSMKQSASSFIHCNVSSAHCGSTLVQSASSMNGIGLTLCKFFQFLILMGYVQQTV